MNDFDSNFFQRMPSWTVGIGLLMVLLAAIEFGFRAGKRTRRRQDAGGTKAGDAELGIIQGSMLGLLGLLLAFFGYSEGLAGERRLGLTTTLAAIIVATAFIILDLDRPRGGLIRVSQQSLTDLRRGMDEPADPAIPIQSTAPASLRK